MLRVVVPEPVLVALPGLSPRPYDVYDAELRRDQEEAEAYLSGLKLQWHGAGVAFNAEVLSGTPAEMIVDVAQGRAVDLIVMSTHAAPASTACSMEASPKPCCAARICPSC